MEGREPYVNPQAGSSAEPNLRGVVRFRMDGELMHEPVLLALTSMTIVEHPRLENPHANSTNLSPHAFSSLPLNNHFTPTS